MISLCEAIKSDNPTSSFAASSLCLSAAADSSMATTEKETPSPQQTSATRPTHLDAAASLALAGAAAGVSRAAEPAAGLFTATRNLYPRLGRVSTKRGFFLSSHRA